MLSIDPDDKKRLIDPLFQTGNTFRIAVIILLVIIGLGVVAYVRQLILGLQITGLHRPVYWGIYMVNFVFLIGVSMAGTLVSASLYLLNADWRRPITRIAESITVFGLLIAGMQIVFDMGRPERSWMLLRYGRLQSPLLWDMTSLSTYILVSLFALYISMLPDMAILRDNFPRHGPAWRRILYTTLALRWRGNREQWMRLEKVIRVVAILIIPIGVSLHTVTAWILATTVQPGWHSTIMGPYFVVGAIFSGVALLFIVLALVRRSYRLGAYIGSAQFNNLSYILIVMSITWFYFTYTEHLVLVAGQEESEFPVLASKLGGDDALGFWAMVIMMIVAAWILIAPRLLPRRAESRPFFQPRFALGSAAATVVFFLLLRVQESAYYSPLVNAGLALGTWSGERIIRLVFWALLAITCISMLSLIKQKMVIATSIAGICIVLGMWLERWNILIPTLNHPHMIAWSTYMPTLTEWTLMAASFALFILLFLLFFKVFPIVSIWEVAEGRDIQTAKEAIDIPMPPHTTSKPPHQGLGWSK